jgi:hypothetical protein
MANFTGNLRTIVTSFCMIIGAVAHRSVPAQHDLLHLAWRRISLAVTRFERLFNLWQAGNLPAPQHPRASKPRAQRAPYIRLPTRDRWLIAILRSHHANAYGGQLRHLLASDEAKAFLAAVPRAAGIIRPVCRLLAVEEAVPPVPKKATPEIPESPSSSGSQGHPARHALTCDARREGRGRAPLLRPQPS